MLLNVSISIFSANSKCRPFLCVIIFKVICIKSIRMFSQLNYDRICILLYSYDCCPFLFPGIETVGHFGFFQVICIFDHTEIFFICKQFRKCNLYITFSWYLKCLFLFVLAFGRNCGQNNHSVGRFECRNKTKKGEKYSYLFYAYISLSSRVQDTFQYGR